MTKKTDQDKKDEAYQILRDYNFKCHWDESRETFMRIYQSKPFNKRKASMTRSQDESEEKLYENVGTIGDWMVRERVNRIDDNVRCFNPRAYCWATGRNLFLKRATLVHVLIDGPGKPLKEKFYFSPKQYTLWLLKNAKKS